MRRLMTGYNREHNEETERVLVVVVVMVLVRLA